MTDIETLDDMAKVVTDWYQNMLARIENYQQIPTGMVMEITSQEAPITMVDDTLKGFVAAMELFHMELVNNPPFVITNEDAH